MDGTSQCQQQLQLHAPALHLEIVQEGLAREFVNKVQNMRKEKNLDVIDRIVTRYRGSKVLESSLETHSDFIRTETLTNVLSSELVLEGEDCL